MTLLGKIASGMLALALGLTISTAAFAKGHDAKPAHGPSSAPATQGGDSAEHRKDGAHGHHGGKGGDSAEHRQDGDHGHHGGKGGNSAGHSNKDGSKHPHDADGADDNAQ